MAIDTNVGYGKQKPVSIPKHTYDYKPDMPFYLQKDANQGYNPVKPMNTEVLKRATREKR